MFSRSLIRYFSVLVTLLPLTALQTQKLLFGSPRSFDILNTILPWSEIVV